MIVTLLGSEDVWPLPDLCTSGSALAKSLSKLGVRPGAVIAVSLPPGPKFVASLMGIWEAGAAALCLPTTLSIRELESVHSQCGSDIVVVDGASEHAVLPRVHALAVPRISRSTGRFSHANYGRSVLDARLAGNPPSASALIMVTSGTTGTPKLVDITCSALIYRLRRNVRFLGEAILERTLCTLPMHFGHGLIGNCLSTIYASGDLTIAPDSVQTAARFFEIVDSEAISFISTVPSFWKMVVKLARSNRSQVTQLRAIGSGSAPLSEGLVQSLSALFPGVHIFNFYGVTEMTNWISAAEVSCGMYNQGDVGTCFGGRAAVLLENGTVCATGEGEIVLKSTAMMRRYRGSPSSTAAALDRGWFRTGDLGKVDETGAIRLRGRLADQINRAGVKLSPLSIEQVIMEYPKVDDVCCFGLTDDFKGERVAVAVVPTPGSTLSAAELRQWLTPQLRSEAIPESWFFLDTLPRSARGKVLRRELRRLFSR